MHHRSPIAGRRPGVHCASAVGLALLILFCQVPDLSAATLLVTGPAGAEVLIDGAPSGTLPLPAPLVLPHGQVMILQVRLPGFVTHEQQVFLLGPTTDLTVNVQLLRMSKRTAVVSSLLLAGSGQFYQGRVNSGWIQMSLQVAAWGSALYGEYQFQNRRDTYEQLDQDYEEALAPSEIAELRDERDAAFSDVEDAKLWRNVSLGAVAAIALYSAFDAWRAHERFYAGVQAPGQSADGTTTALVGLRWHFGGGAR